MMRVFPLAAPPMGGVPFSTGKAQPYGLTLVKLARRPLITLNATTGDVINESHDFRDTGRYVLVATNGEIDRIEISGHSAIKAIIFDKAEDFSHVVDGLRTGFNTNTALSSK